MKSVAFLSSSRAALRSFPADARRSAGFQLERVQRGLNPFDWKPMPSVGAGAAEIRVRSADGAFRVIYLAKLADAVYVLHAFQKKSQQTAALDLDLARTRYAVLVRRTRP